MQAEEASSTLIASRPIERTALRTKSMSTSEAYLLDISTASKILWRENVLLQLSEHLRCVLGSSKSIYDLKLGELDVYWVVVFAEEDFNIILENHWPPLNNQQYIPESDILDLGAGREHGYCRGMSTETFNRAEHVPRGGPIFLQMCSINRRFST